MYWLLGVDTAVTEIACSPQVVIADVRMPVWFTPAFPILLSAVTKLIQ